MDKNMKKFIEVGNSIEIPIIIEGEKVMLKSSVEGLANDRIVISAPILKLNYYPIRSGDVFKIYVKVESGIVEFKASVLKRVKIRNILTIVLEALTEPILVQRREFFRLNILKEVLVTYKEEKTFNLTTKEISAGGLSGIVVDFGDVLVGEKVQIKFDIDSEEIDLTGEIVYCSLFKDSIRRYEYRIKFLNVSQITRTKLLNYIFNEQRKLMRKK